MIDRPTERPIGRPAGWSAGRPVGQSGALRGWSIGRSVVGRSVGRSVDRPVRRSAGAHGLSRTINTVTIIWFPAVKPLPSISPAFRMSVHHICFQFSVRRSTRAVEKPTSGPVKRSVPIFSPSSPKQTRTARTLARHAGQGGRWALRLDHSACRRTTSASGALSAGTRRLSKNKPQVLSASCTSILAELV